MDDDVLLRTSCASLLEASGHIVIQAGDGAEALRRLLDDGTRPELLVVDLEMPGMGGWELLAILRGTADRELAALPVMIVSALDLSDRARAVYPSLRKPVPPERMLETIGQLLAIARPSFG
ncbi:MAG TPA: response regulator [Polyangia bacterium]|nr:response regulator [Polyangia bacterium]